MIKQIAVFLENKEGKASACCQVLKDAGVNLYSISIADTTDFGILRLIVSEVDRAVEILREANFAVMLTDVVCLRCDNVAGSLSVILEQLAENQIFIEYMYAFAEGEQANVIIRPNDITRCVEVLSDCKCNVVKEF